MLMPNESRLRLIWWLLTTAIVITSLVPGLNFHDPRIVGYIDSDWAHFLAYAAAGAITVLAWRLGTGLALSSGMALASFGLQVLRGLLSSSRTDFEGAVINLLGLAAGVFIGLHIRRSESHAKRRLALNTVARAGRDPARSLSGRESISARDAAARREPLAVQKPDLSTLPAIETAVTE
jgi:hypothetical protein